MPSIFRCIECGRRYTPGSTLRCKCDGLLEVEHEFVDIEQELFDGRLGSRDHPYISGVWRFKEMVYPDMPNGQIISRPEGNTNLYGRRRVEEYVGAKKLELKHEGENPSGSFKDRGMTVGISEAKRLNAGAVACASTGNTSASLAAYAAQAGIGCVVFVPEGEIASGKLSQALAYGAKALQVMGNFDDAMRIVQQASEALGLYLLNSVNPWRIEGQKTIMYELMQQRRWRPPQWIALPAGNLGNTSAFGKALSEMKHLGLINEVPKLAAIQAEGANPFYRLWKSGKRKLTLIENAETVASAIRIGAPVSWRKALDAVKCTCGVVEQVSDQEIMDAKAVVDASGVGCEPASAASVAGAKKLIEAGIVDPDEEIVCVLTGNILKDPDSTIRYHTGTLKDISPKFANRPLTIEPEITNVEEKLHELGVGMSPS